MTKNEKLEQVIPDLSGDNVGNWGSLKKEPCRFCLQVGGVQFLIDDSPYGRNTPQVVRCVNCHNYWDVDGRVA